MTLETNLYDKLLGLGSWRQEESVGKSRELVRDKIIKLLSSPDQKIALSYESMLRRYDYPVSRDKTNALMMEKINLLANLKLPWLESLSSHKVIGIVIFFDKFLEKS